MTKRTVFLYLSLLAGHSVLAADWAEVSQSDNAVIYVDTDSIRTHKIANGRIFRSVWEKWEYDSAQSLPSSKNISQLFSDTLYPIKRTATEQEEYDKKSKYWSMRIFTYYDCSNKKSKTDAANYYNFYNNPIDSINFSINLRSSDDWNRAVPDTVGESTLNFVCSAKLKNN
ncbi:hypothetical protein SAMN02745664_10459 [Moraxella cuniculi DSM 21768]|uniref:Surface-adhesin protein E-like domain-containing protein n=1 Tax=Moraxella cuniculi DSM 21768 TaxID=1122245 RepID=A0A1N7ECX0_9GAMM|nr:surface-adhesin E family protein [Moraxella cuniculi]OOS05343.1 hypothetical protein B0189_06975 [Moraxella cuniculi]SIR85927.1 hypothetical protein SAMN02745664_10459 [Moraxella cuniculi DSM 21768]